MSIMSVIKGTRRVHTSNWKYQVVHFTFGVKTTNKEVMEALENESRYVNGLPIYLYNHFCPIFWLSLICVLVLPITITIRVVCELFKLVVLPTLKIFASLVEKLVDFITAKYFPTPTEEELKLQADDEAREFFIEFIKKNYYCGATFEYLYDLFQRCYKECFDVNEYQRLFNKYVEVLNNKKVVEEKKNKVRSEKIIFAIRMSENIIKGALAVFYVVAVLFVLWCLYSLVLFGAPIAWDIMRALWSYSALEVILMLTTIILSIIFVSLIVLVSGLYLENVGFFKWANKMLKAPIKLFSRVTRNMGEFIEVFYEENCPKVIIISDEEAQMESED